MGKTRPPGGLAFNAEKKTRPEVAFHLVESHEAGRVASKLAHTGSHSIASGKIVADGSTQRAAHTMPRTVSSSWAGTAVNSAQVWPRPE